MVICIISTKGLHFCTAKAKILLTLKTCAVLCTIQMNRTRNILFSHWRHKTTSSKDVKSYEEVPMLKRLPLIGHTHLFLPGSTNLNN